jgi:hypothetical protein
MVTTKTVRAFVAHLPGQGVRLDLMSETKRHVWEMLTEDDPWRMDDEKPPTRSEMRKFGWAVLPCTVAVELPEPVSN